MIWLYVVSALLRTSFSFNADNNVRASIFRLKPLFSISSSRPKSIDEQVFDLYPPNFNVPNDFNDYHKIPVNHPYFVNMPIPLEQGPAATAYANHFLWRRRLTDTES